MESFIRYDGISFKDFMSLYEQHRLYLKTKGKEGKRLELFHTYFNKFDFSHMVLDNAVLKFCIINECNFKGTSLVNVDLSHSSIYYSSFYKANLKDGNLKNTTFLRNHFFLTNLINADISSSYISSCSFGDTIITNANFEKTVLSDTTLQSTTKDAKIFPYIPLYCPDTGSFIGWKKCYIIPELKDYPVIVKLLIPNDAKRTSAFSSKCRCSKAKVLEIQDIEGNQLTVPVYSGYDKTFVYEVGKTVYPNRFDDNRWHECANGIHFFVNKQEAINYI